MKIDPDEHHHAIFCDPAKGPTFGGGHDIHIASNANTTMDSSSNLGYAYKHPQYEEGTNEAKTFFQSFMFSLIEILHFN